jgi:pyridoxal phosphate enzyme (YggS family)
MSEIGSVIAAAMAGIERRIAAAGGHDVRIVAVTKGFDADLVRAARLAGCGDIGENYAQELLSKAAALEPDNDGRRPRVHFIGRLQTNKVRQIAHLVDVYDSVDRVSLIDELARRVPGAEMLIQVNSTGETSKSGCRPDEVDTLVEHAVAAGLRVEGLMTVGPTDGDPDVARSGFALVRRLVDSLGLVTCSMGMSNDLEVAIAEGSNEIRVGSALFGQRPPR